MHRVRQEADFQSLAVAYKRAANILKQASSQGMLGQDGDEFMESRMVEETEKALAAQIEEIRIRTAPQLESGDYESALKEMVGLKPAVDAFFEKVMVMAEDPVLRKNRLAILSRLRRLFYAVADFSCLQ